MPKIHVWGRDFLSIEWLIDWLIDQSIYLLLYSFFLKLFSLHLQYTVVTELMKQGDENVKAKLHEDALMCYTLALNQQAPPFMDIAIISEKLYRKRAVCYFKMVSLIP